MSRPRHVAELLHQLRGADSPIRRLRILARAWRTVRELTPAERRQMAEQLQLEGADRLLEQLGLRDGIDPEAVLQAVSRAETEDLGQLRELLHGLRDPGARHDLAAAAAARLAGRASAQQAEDVPSLPGPGEGAEEEFDAATSASEGVPAKPPPARDVAGREEQPDAPDPAVMSSHDHAVITPREVAPGDSLRADDVPVQAPPLPGVGPRAAAPVSPPTDLRRTKPGSSSRDPIASPAARLRQIGRQVADLGTRSPKELLAVIEEFPPGWARRRAVQALFRAGLPAELMVALDLADVAAAGSWVHTWCLATLMTNRPLTDAQRMTVLGRARTAPARRRLASLAPAR